MFSMTDGQIYELPESNFTQGRGDLNVSEKEKLKPQNVLYALDIAQNIISLRKVVNSGVKVELSQKGIQLIYEKQNKTIKEGLYDGHFWI